MISSKNTISQGSRIQSIDFLRGAVMIVMAIDHVRVYSGIPAGGPTAGIFFTRWITHYCAPAFVFFAGTSAFLYLQRTADKKELGRFLLVRGLILVIFELTVVRFFWMFNLDYATFTFAGVIWMLGWSMVILAACVRLKPLTLAVTGLSMIAFQQVFAWVPAVFPESLDGVLRTLWNVFYPSAIAARPGAALLSGTSGFPTILGINIFYVLIPWIGVMMTGFGFGEFFKWDEARRNKMFLRIGIAASVLFLIAGTAFILFQAPKEDAPPFIFRLLNQQKYPPSQLYLLMTLGPLIALLPWAEKIQGKVVQAIVLIGRVPMFYYILHLLIIHLSALVVNLILSGNAHQDWYQTAPFVGMAEDQRWGLPLLYLVWVMDVIILYFICSRYARYKSAHPEVKWLKYI